MREIFEPPFFRVVKPADAPFPPERFLDATGRPPAGWDIAIFSIADSWTTRLGKASGLVKAPFAIAAMLRSPIAVEDVTARLYHLPSGSVIGESEDWRLMHAAAAVLEPLTDWTPFRPELQAFQVSDALMNAGFTTGLKSFDGGPPVWLWSRRALS